MYTEKPSSARKEYLQCTGFRKASTAASNCIGCGKCEKHCPQGIAIRQELKNASKELETPAYKLFRKVIEIVKAF
jgi:predicted aldo/keto reductase-like oxidoreductase